MAFYKYSNLNEIGTSAEVGVKGQVLNFKKLNFLHSHTVTDTRMQTLILHTLGKKYAATSCTQVRFGPNSWQNMLLVPTLKIGQQLLTGAQPGSLQRQKLLLITPGVGQDKQRARRCPIGAWLDLPAFEHLSVR
eukprot:1136157-Pelagomonas_calceolata.AAC.5